MPYITQDKREKLSHVTNQIAMISSMEVGDLVYLLYKACLRFIEIQGERFFTFAWVIGGLVCCALEIYRRHVSAYEDDCIEKNGDVY